MQAVKPGSQKRLQPTPWGLFWPHVAATGSVLMKLGGDSEGSATTEPQEEPKALPQCFLEAQIPRAQPPPPKALF